MKENCSAHCIETTPGVKLYVRDWGKGQNILFVHGWPFDHRIFEYQLVQFPSKGYRCIAIDTRGSGKSDAPWGPYTYDMIADDIKKVIDTLDLHDVIIAGFSIGGAMVTHYLAKHNQHRIKKAILLSAAAPCFTKRPDFPWGFTKEEVDVFIKSTYEDRPAMIAGFGKILFNKQPSAPFNDWVQQMCTDAAPNATAEYLFTLRDADLRADVSKITVPTAIFHGTKDKVCPFELGEYMHKNIKGSKLVRFEESGHGLWHDELEKFNREFLSFVGQ